MDPAPACLGNGPPIGELVRRLAERLAGLPDAKPRLEAELLVCELSGLERSALYAWPERRLLADQLERLEHLVQRRLQGEPLAYLLGRWGFWGLELQVTPDTLIPRPETELLVEIALAALPAERPLQIADLGTGSGAIAAALASERPHWRLIATDRSGAALAVARDNFRRLGLTVDCLQTDWLAAFAPASLDAILSNPPYVAECDPHLARGALPFEPQIALVAGPDGLAAIRAILADACRCLKPGGLIALEHGYDQGARVRKLFAERGLIAVATRRDLSGQERVTLGYRPG